MAQFNQLSSICYDHLISWLLCCAAACAAAQNKTLLVIVGDSCKNIRNCIGIKNRCLLSFGFALAWQWGKNECWCDAVRLSFPKTTCKELKNCKELKRDDLHDLPAPKPNRDLPNRIGFSSLPWCKMRFQSESHSVFLVQACKKPNWHGVIPGWPVNDHLSARISTHTRAKSCAPSSCVALHRTKHLWLSWSLWSQRRRKQVFIHVCEQHEGWCQWDSAHTKNSETAMSQRTVRMNSSHWCQHCTGAVDITLTVTCCLLVAQAPHPRGNKQHFEKQDSLFCSVFYCEAMGQFKASS